MALAQELREYEGTDALVMAVPRGGVPVGFVLARELGLPMDLLLIKKIGHPANHEYAIGAVSLTDRSVSPMEPVAAEYLDEETERVRERLRGMNRDYRGDRPQAELRGRTIIVVDDGVATGQTLLEAIRLLRKSLPRKIIVAVPVASDTAYRMLLREADQVCCLLVPERFHGVGAFYQDFSQVSDEEVIHDMVELGRLGNRKAM